MIGNRKLVCTERVVCKVLYGMHRSEALPFLLIYGGRGRNVVGLYPLDISFWF